MRILALDLGTTTGWASVHPIGGIENIEYGKWNLQPSRHEDSGMRWVKLRRSLTYYDDIKLLVYEEIAAHKGTAAAHIYGGLVATVQTWCKQEKITYTGVPVGTIKKHATGKGNAGKAQMIQAANEAFKFLHRPLGATDHDIADALWILDWAKKEYIEGILR